MECSIVEYYEMLKNHDWYYDFSDDHLVWTSGNASKCELELIAETKGLDYKRMYEEFKAAMFSGDAFGNPKLEIPRINEFL